MVNNNQNNNNKRIPRTFLKIMSKLEFIFVIIFVFTLHSVNPPHGKEGWLVYIEGDYHEHLFPYSEPQLPYLKESYDNYVRNVCENNCSEDTIKEICENSIIGKIYISTSSRLQDNCLYKIQSDIESTERISWDVYETYGIINYHIEAVTRGEPCPTFDDIFVRYSPKISKENHNAIKQKSDEIHKKSYDWVSSTYWMNIVSFLVQNFIINSNPEMKNAVYWRLCSFLMLLIPIFPVFLLLSLAFFANYNFNTFIFIVASSKIYLDHTYGFSLPLDVIPIFLYYFTPEKYGKIATNVQTILWYFIIYGEMIKGTDAYKMHCAFCLVWVIYHSFRYSRKNNE